MWSAGRFVNAGLVATRPAGGRPRAAPGAVPTGPLADTPAPGVNYRPMTTRRKQRSVSPRVRRPVRPARRGSRAATLVASLGLLGVAAAGAAAQGPPPARMTRWARAVRPARVLPEYPRPQLVRPAWQNLNGLWDYAITDSGAPQPESWDGRILVPFAAQSQL
jgi:hypothetical protein